MYDIGIEQIRMLYQGAHHRETTKGVPYRYTKVLTAILTLHKGFYLFANKLPKSIVFGGKITIPFHTFYSYNNHFWYVGNPLGELLHKGSEIIEVSLRIEQIDHWVIRRRKRTVLIGRRQVDINNTLPTHKGRRKRKTLSYTNSCLCPSTIHR